MTAPPRGVRSSAGSHERQCAAAWRQLLVAAAAGVRDAVVGLPGPIALAYRVLQGYAVAGEAAYGLADRGDLVALGLDEGPVDGDAVAGHDLGPGPDQREDDVEGAVPLERERVQPDPRLGRLFDQVATQHDPGVGHDH